LCLVALALIGGGCGCQSLPVPKPLGKRPEKPPELRTSKGEAYYHYLKAQRYLLAEDILGAIKEYQEAAQYDPNSADLHIELALLYQRHGEMTKALSHVEKALKIDPKNQDAHFSWPVCMWA
jgi:Tfp pilus assembly protein PilF